MEKYNYLKEITNDIIYWMDREGDPFDISQFEDRDEAANFLCEELWEEDSITGNGPYNYSDEFLSEEYLCHNLDLIIEACEGFGVNYEKLRQQYKNGMLARYLDGAIRCYLLPKAVYEALKIWESYGFEYKNN